MTSHRDGHSYIVSEQDKTFYLENGYVSLPDVLSEDELLPIEQVYDAFLDRRLGCISVMNKDFCDMSQDFSTPYQDYVLVNAMLPTRYHPPLRGNLFESLAQDIAKQLLGDDMVFDYDQFLTKRPNKKDAVFAMHQDMGYWPQTKDTRTATFSLAITPSTLDNGCIWFLPGSGKAKKLYQHKHKDENSHTVLLDIPESQAAQRVYVQVPRGSVTVHDEWIVHGSEGNQSSGFRKTYVCAFRAKNTVDFERSIGFDHSHNFEKDWRSVDAQQ